MTLGRLLGALVPESPARTAGEQLALALGRRHLVADLDALPTTPDPTDPDPTDHPQED